MFSTARGYPQDLLTKFALRAPLWSLARRSRLVTLQMRAKARFFNVRRAGNRIVVEIPRVAHLTRPGGIGAEMCRIAHERVDIQGSIRNCAAGAAGATKDSIAPSIRPRRATGFWSRNSFMVQGNNRRKYRVPSPAGTSTEFVPGA